MLNIGQLHTFDGNYMRKKLSDTIERFIKNTPRKGYVKELRIKISKLPKRFKSKTEAQDLRVYITTKSLKHMYDIRLAQEFDFIIANIEAVITNPHRIYKNKEGKTGSVCLYIKLQENFYFYILDAKPDGLYVVSAYRLSEIEVKRKNYLASYKLLWSWKGDLPSS